MKKRLISFLVLISTFLFIGNVQAIEIDKDDIETGSYVIGTHLFERKVTEHYDGTLTVKHIMLAAQSIGSNDIKDMVIYLKNSRGNWVDGLTYEPLEVPENIKIEYQNTVDITVPSPILGNIGGIGSDYVNFIDGEYLYDISINMHNEQYNNWKLYEKNGNDYKLLDSINMFQGKNVRVEAGTKKTFVAKLCKLDNDKEVCSDYSNELVIDTMKNIIKPELSIYVLGVADGKFQFDMGGTPEDISFSHLDGVDYFEKNNNGQYILINTAKPGYALYKEIDVNDVKTYVAKSYALNKSGEKVYSDYSEELVVDPSDYIDKAFGYIEREYPQNNLYNSNTGMYTFYTKINTDYNYFGAWTLYEVEYDENHEIVSKTPILTEYTGVPIRVDIEAGQSKRLMAGLCLNRSDNNYPMTCDYAYTEVGKIDTREFLKTPVLTNYGYSSSEKEKVYYDIDYNYNDYISSSLSGIPSPTVSGISYYKLLEDGSLGFISDSYIATGGPALSFDYGTVTKIFAKAFVIDSKGNRHYSDYSNELVLDTTEVPLLKYINSGGSSDGEIIFEINYDDYENMDGIELYYNDHGGEWHLVDESNMQVSNPDLGYNNFIKIYYDSYDYFEYLYKARLYTEDEFGERTYTEFSPYISTQYSHDGTSIALNGIAGAPTHNEMEFAIYNEGMTNVAGAELYYYNGNTWNLITDIIEENNYGHGCSVRFKFPKYGPDFSEDYLYKGRLYQIDSETGEKAYTDFSPIIAASYSVNAALHVNLIGINTENGKKTYALEMEDYYREDYHGYDGLEIYYLSDNEYIWHLYDPIEVVTDVNSSNIKYIKFDEEEVVNSIKVVVYKDLENGIRLYKTSNFLYDSSVIVPGVIVENAGADEENNYMALTIEHESIEHMDGVEIYYTDGISNWQLYDNEKVQVSEGGENVLLLPFSPEEAINNYSYKVRLYKINSATGEKFYTYYSAETTV